MIYNKKIKSQEIKENLQISAIIIPTYCILEQGTEDNEEQYNCKKVRVIYHYANFRI